MSTSTEPINAENALSGESSVGQLLEKLIDFEPTTLPVLSVYLNMQPDQHGRTPDLRPYLEREFKSLARTWPLASGYKSSRLSWLVIEPASSVEPVSSKARKMGVFSKSVTLRTWRI